MRKSLRLLFASFILAASVAAVASTTSTKTTMGSGGDPVPICPPGLCAIN